MRWKLKHLFNSQFCQKYFSQKLLKYANLSSSYNIYSVGDVFLGFLFISTHFAWSAFPR